MFSFVVDLDGDGQPDLLEQSMYIYKGVGFRSPSSALGPDDIDWSIEHDLRTPYLWTSAPADLDGDGHADLVFIYGGDPMVPERVRVKLGPFPPGTIDMGAYHYELVFPPSGIASTPVVQLVDFDGDGRATMLISSSPADGSYTMHLLDLPWRVDARNWRNDEVDDPWAVGVGGLRREG